MALAAAATFAHAGEVSVAAAANLAGPIQKIAAAFTEETGHQAVIALGSTGKFYAQIRNGAPFQVLLAADEETPLRLENDGLGVAGSRLTYATGRLVLWSATPGRVDSEGAVLRQGTFRHLAIADPKLAPYGAAAQQVLAALGLAATLQPRIVQGENIAQAHQFVASGNAELGFVARSQVTLDGVLTSGSAWLVPAQLHRPLRQDAVLLLKGKDQPAALAWLNFLRSDKARAILRSHGSEA